MRRILLILVLCSSGYGAEFLLYNQINWMEKLTAEKRQEYFDKGKLTESEYLGRDRPGDVVEVRPDGFWKDRGCGPFRVVKVPGLKVEDAYKYMARSPGLYERRRYSIRNTGGKKLSVKVNELDLKDNLNEEMVDPTTGRAISHHPAVPAKVCALGLCLVVLWGRSRRVC